MPACRRRRDPAARVLNEPERGPVLVYFLDQASRDKEARELARAISAFIAGSSGETGIEEMLVSPLAKIIFAGAQGDRARVVAEELRASQGSTFVERAQLLQERLNVKASESEDSQLEQELHGLASRLGEMLGVRPGPDA